MIHFLFILLGLASPDKNTSYINQTSTAVQYNTDLNEDIDTSGETTQFPPKK